MRDLSLAGVFSGVDLTVHAGEIVGLAGLVGAGRSEILETIYGARRATSGTVTVDGKRLAAGLGHLGGPCRGRPGAGGAQEPGAAARRGGLPQHHDVVDDAGSPASASSTGVRSGAAPPSSPRASTYARPASTRAVRTLSGGNQQKIVLARWLLRDCRVLMLDEPTRGVDVGARSEIYQLVRSLADRGVAVVVVSSEIEEVLGLADRVLVVRRARSSTRSAATDLDEARVLDLVMEGKVASGSEPGQRARRAGRARDHRRAQPMLALLRTQRGPQPRPRRRAAAAVPRRG